MEKTSTFAAPTPPEPSAADSWLTIDLDALAANYRTLRQVAKGARTAGVIKADGYGLGAVPVGRRLAREGCDLFFVAHLGEALRLRREGGGAIDRAEVAVLNGIPPGQEGLAVEHRIQPVLNTPEAVEAWLDAIKDRTDPPRAFLQVETGMNRLGLDAEGLARISNRLPQLPLAAVMSHLACADTPDAPMNDRQRERFAALAADLPEAPRSLASSAAILSNPKTHFDLVRPGIGLYGANPFADRPNPMAPVVTLEARILQTRRIDRGEAVGYGATYVAEGPRRVATLSVGYADGYKRAAGGRATASIAGIALPVIGRVSMDLITVDVTQAPEEMSQTGDRITLLGGEQDADALGKAAGTLGYEILTSLGQRYARQYKGG